MKKIVALVLVLAMLFTSVACGKKDEDANVIKIGGIGPTTGPAAIYGVATQYGAQIAVEEINALGGIQFELNWQDDEHDAEKAVNAYNTLMDWGMDILVGTTTTNPSIAVSTEAYEDRIFMFTPSASSPKVTEGKDYVFQMCFTDPSQGVRSAQYIIEKGLGTKVAIIYNNADAYSAGIYEGFKAEAEKNGVEIVSVTTFTDDTATDFTAQLNDAKTNGADFVFLPIYYTPASLILAQAKSIDYAPVFCGVDGMDGILTLEGFDAALAEDVMLLTPFSADAQEEPVQDFVKKYEKLAGEKPNQFAADAYDCVYAIYNAIQKNGIKPGMKAEEMCDKLIETFTSADFSYTGLTGSNMTWQANGEVDKAPKGYVIKNGAYVEL